jgi:hypothetical protein
MKVCYQFLDGLIYQQRVLSKALIVAKDIRTMVITVTVKISRKRAKPENASKKNLQSMQPAQLCP